MAPLALQREDGFTFVELLVVILVIAVLAAIALPMFLGQRAKGQDASAKSDARTLAGQVEACFTTTERYDACESGDVGLDDGGMPSSVSAAAVAGGYDVTATSLSGNTFLIERHNGNLTRTCSDAGDPNGGCEGTSW